MRAPENYRIAMKKFLKILIHAKKKKLNCNIKIIKFSNL